MYYTISKKSYIFIDKNRKSDIMIENLLTKIKRKKMTHKLPMEQMLHAYLFETRAIALNAGRYNVRGVSTTAPIGVFLQHIIADDAAMELFTEALATHVPNGITHIAGFGFDGIPFACSVAKKVGKIPLPLQRDPVSSSIAGFSGYKPLSGANVLLLSGIIGTGRNSAEAMQMLTIAGGKCDHVSSIFDYGFNLTTTALTRNTIAAAKFESLTTVDTVVHYAHLRGISTKELKEWRSSEMNLFRNAHSKKHQETFV